MTAKLHYHRKYVCRPSARWHLRTCAIVHCCGPGSGCTVGYCSCVLMLFTDTTCTHWHALVSTCSNDFLLLLHPCDDAAGSLPACKAAAKCNQYRRVCWQLVTGSKPYCFPVYCLQTAQLSQCDSMRMVSSLTVHIKASSSHCSYNITQPLTQSVCSILASPLPTSGLQVLC